MLGGQISLLRDVYLQHVQARLKQVATHIIACNYLRARFLLQRLFYGNHSVRAGLYKS